MSDGHLGISVMHGMKTHTEISLRVNTNTWSMFHLDCIFTLHYEVNEVRPFLLSLTLSLMDLYPSLSSMFVFYSFSLLSLAFFFPFLPSSVFLFLSLTIIPSVTLLTFAFHFSILHFIFCLFLSLHLSPFTK